MSSKYSQAHIFFKDENKDSSGLGTIVLEEINRPVIYKGTAYLKSKLFRIYLIEHRSWKQYTALYPSAHKDGCN